MLEDIEVELRTIMGFTAKGTLKLKGIVKEKGVVVMIDSGTSHNIHQRLVDELGLKIVEEARFGVTVGDGTVRAGWGLCKRVEVKLLELTIIEDFLAIEPGRMDVILGMQWL